MNFSRLFEGRLGRAHFAWAQLAFLVAVILVRIVFSSLDLILDGIGALMTLASAVAIIAMVVVNVGVTVRRYHDMAWSGWFVLLNFIPFVNVVMLLVLLFRKGTAGSNRFGAPFPAEMPLKEAVLNAGPAAAARPAQHPQAHADADDASGEASDSQG